MTLASTTYVIPLTTIYRRRMLPAPGRLLVRQGQKVAPNDVVAEANLAAEHVLLDVARGLSVSPKKADQLIDRVAGEQVAEGDLIATRRRGLVSRTMRTPVEGKIVYIRNGQVLLQKAETPYQLKAGYNGLVSEMIAERGVVIEMVGALIQGVWGNGKMDFGAMQMNAETPGERFVIDQVDVSLRGGVLAGGYLDDEAALEVLAEIPIRGLVLASMPARLIPAAQTVPYPVILTEGFGERPMNIAAFRLLSSNSGREININAEPLALHQGTRPEIVIPLPVSGNPPIPPLPGEYAPEQRVRVVRAPYTSRVGTILNLRPGLSAVPSGLQAASADVRLETGERVVLPLANLEVIEYK